MKRLLITALLLLSSTAHADFNLEPLKNKWFWASNAAMIADYSTTLSISRQEGYVESAPFTRKMIGENPTTGRVQKYFASRLIINTLVLYMAPPKVSKFINQVQTVVHFTAAANNYRIGLKFSF